MNIVIQLMNIIIRLINIHNLLLTLQYLAVEMEMGIFLAPGDAFRIDSAPCAVTQF